ncbi:MAG: exodeoxyribonuclease III [Sandaracinaceae bacterium]|nr:exodeoxyribonuclease III [Sandaracinaceae bacterium]
MRLITWNLNSIRVRLERLLALLARHDPDIVCLQELKSDEENFPYLAIEKTGYFSAVYGQRGYNGVAILSKEPLRCVEKGFGSEDFDSQARLIAGTWREIRIVCAYFPNGGEIGSERYAYKLRWMEGLLGWLKKKYSPEEPIILAGDFNVAPEERDVAFPERWKNTVLFSDEVRASLQRIRAWGFYDSLRLVNQSGGIYSWWDYRALAFPKNDGLRIDHIDVTRPLCDKVQAVWVDREERKGKQPSDHAPVILDARHE